MRILMREDDKELIKKNSPGSVIWDVKAGRQVCPAEARLRCWCDNSVDKMSS